MKNFLTINEAVIVLTCFTVPLALGAIITEEKTNVVCVPIVECPSLLKLLKQQPMTYETQELLRAANCGFDGKLPKVWCKITKNTCKTPQSIIENTQLICVPIYQCPSLLKLLKERPLTYEAQEFLRYSNCGFEGKMPYVWCKITKNPYNIPNYEFGICLPLPRCDTLQHLYQTSNTLNLESQKYLRNFECESNDKTIMHVCCPTKTPIEGKPPIEQLPIEEELPITTRPPIEEKPPVEVYPPGVETPTENASTEVNPLPEVPVIEDKFPKPEEPPEEIPPNTSIPNILPKPAEGQCGLQSFTNKLVGGVVADIDEFPWTVLLEYEQDSDKSRACGGSLINDRYVVTAAHCVDKSALTRIGNLTHIILGEYDIRNETDCVFSLNFEDCADPIVSAPIESIITHPLWNKRNPSVVNHDIALIRLAISVTYSDFIKPICLPSATFTIKPEQQMYVSGWGQTETGKNSDVKLKVKLPLADREKCAEIYKTEKKITLGDGLICAGGEEGKDSCTGDSGGPLMVTAIRNDTQIWFLAGVVSFGYNYPCGAEGYPGAYTFLPKYIDWIYQTIKP